MAVIFRRYISAGHKTCAGLAGLTGHHWQGTSQCSICGERLRCDLCGAFVREDNLDAHFAVAGAAQCPGLGDR